MTGTGRQPPNSCLSSPGGESGYWRIECKRGMMGQRRPCLSFTFTAGLPWVPGHMLQALAMQQELHTGVCC